MVDEEYAAVGRRLLRAVDKKLDQHAAFQPAQLYELARSAMIALDLAGAGRKDGDWRDDGGWGDVDALDATSVTSEQAEAELDAADVSWSEGTVAPHDEMPPRAFDPPSIRMRQATITWTEDRGVEVTGDAALVDEFIATGGTDDELRKELAKIIGALVSSLVSVRDNTDDRGAKVIAEQALDVYNAAMRALGAV